jgi:membrane protein
VGTLVWINLVVRFAFVTAAWTATLPSLAPAVPAVEEDGEEPVTAGAPPVAGR